MNFRTLRFVIIKFITICVLLSAVAAFSYGDTAVYLEVIVPPSATAGNIFYITVTAKSISGTTVTDYAGEIDFSSSTLSYLPSSYIFQPIDGGVHVFPVQIMGAGDQSITAFDLNTPSVSGSNVLTVSAASTSFFSISAPSVVSAGQVFYITVTAKDDFNNLTVLYAGTASFQSTDALSVIPPDTAFQRDDNGSKVLAVILKTKGTQVVSAADLVNPSISGSSNAIAVSSGIISKFTVDSPSTANPGTGFNIAVTAQDLYNNIVDNYTGTVHFASTDAGAVLPSNSAFLPGDYGNRIFPVTLNTAGTQTITVNDVSAPTINAVSHLIAVNSNFNSYNQPLLLTSYLPSANLYQYIYLRVSAPANTAIPANAYLEYDVFMPSYNADFFTGADMAGAVFGTLRDYGQATQSYIKDQNAIRCHPSMDLSAYAGGTWYHRKFDIGVLSGSTYNQLNLAQDTGNAGQNGAPSNSAGTFNALYDNIAIKDSSGNILKNFFSNNNVIPFTNAVSLDGSVAANQGSGGISAPPPLNNYIWIIKDMNLSANPSGSIIANGINSCTITANLFAPGSVPVSYALTDFISDRAEDVIAPVAVSLNVKAITDGAGNAKTVISSTKAGVADITVRSGNLSKIIAVNFVAGPSAKLGIIPGWLSTETNVQGSMIVNIEDAYANFVPDGRTINLTSGSGTLKFSSDNGATWLSAIAFTGAVQRNILIIDTTAETVTVQATAAGITTAFAQVYVNNAPATALGFTPVSSTAKAGIAVIYTVQSKDSSGNNTYQSGSVQISSLSSTMKFSSDGLNYTQVLDAGMTDGRADIYCLETVAAANVTITALSAGLTPGKASVTTIPNDPAILDGFSNKYAVTAGQSVTITAVITDIYGNAVSNKFITFTAQVEGGLGDSAITPTGNSTNSSGQVTVVFRTKSTSAALNYCILNSTGLLGKTITIAGSAVAASYSILPNPVASGADKSVSIFLNAKDAGNYNAPAPVGHDHVYVYVTQPAGTSNVFFSVNGGINWYNSVTATLDSSGAAQVDVKSHFPNTYILRGMDTSAVAPLGPASATLTVSTAYYVSVSPLAAVNAAAGSSVTVSAQIVDQNGAPALLVNKRVDFSVNRGSMSPVTVYTDANGLATTYLTLALGAYLQHFVTATVTNPDAVSTSAAITGLPVISFAVSIPSTASINTPVNAIVRAKDAYGETMANYTGTVHFTSSDPLAILPVDSAFTLSDAGIRTFSVTFGTSNPQAQTIMVTDASQPSIKGISNTIIMFLNPTPTPTISPTRTITPTRTPSPTYTVTPTVTQTGTNTYTRTVTQTHTASPTFTRTTTSSITTTSTITATITRTYTITQTSTISKTWTVSPTFTATPTITQTWTDSPTFTPTQTFTVTYTNSPTYTATLTSSSSPTFTPTFTVTQTYSFTNTNTSTVTNTFTPTFTGTMTSTLTFTATDTLSATGTFTATRTITISPTYTVTQTSTASATFTPTYTATGTYTSTITDTSTVTATFTPTFTITATITLTLIATITTTATLTHTITPTETYYYKKANTGESYVFPQPAVISVSIAYSLTEDAQVYIYIYNTAGMQVATFNQQGAVSDYNRFTIGLDKFSPGVYYYLIRAKTTSGADIKFNVNKFLVVKSK